MANAGVADTNPRASVLDSFLTPEAMLTPGAAGAMTMMITNALGVSFSSPRALTALILSFVFGLLVLVANKAIVEKAVYYVLNSLVIFCVANGANGLGSGAARQVEGFLVGSAFAQAASPAVVAEQPQPTLMALTEKYNDLTKQIESAKTNATSKGDLVRLVEERDAIDKQRNAILKKEVKAQTGVSIEDIAKKESGSTAKVIRDPFFSQWKFRF